jgi:hypothetical protein
VDLRSACLTRLDFLRICGKNNVKWAKIARRH